MILRSCLVKKAMSSDPRLRETQKVQTSEEIPLHSYLLDSYSWLYACRGLYQSKEYHLVIEGLSYCLRNEKTMKEV